MTRGITRNISSKTELPGSNYVTMLGISEIAGGALTETHTHPGIESAYVLEGECDLVVDGQADRKLKPSDSYQIPPGVPHSLRNGPKTAKIAVTFVVEKDKPLASPA
jgi:quercetin dioxygenase-like cupin family protein